MFNKVVIVGIGLLGGSLARDLRARGLARHIVGVSRSQATADRAIVDNVVDEVCDLQTALEQADLVVLATPMQAMLSLLQKMQPMLSENTVITDVGSVKTHLYQELADHCPALLSRFVLAHPIAGGENSGVGASRVDLFAGKHVIITETPEVDRTAASQVAQMWERCGARVLTMSLQQHDAIFAQTSHLPHVVAFSLVNYLGAQENREELFNLAAAGFYDFTRIASSDAEMWRDICITNQAEVIAAIDGFTAHMEQIRAKIASSDQGEILQYFAQAKLARDAGLRKKNSA